MIADPQNYQLKCYFEGSSMRVFELRGLNATKARCTEECLKNYLCVEVSGIWSEWCFGCKFELSGNNFAVGEIAMGAKAFKKRKRPGIFIADVSYTVLGSDKAHKKLYQLPYSLHYS